MRRRRVESLLKSASRHVLRENSSTWAEMTHEIPIKTNLKRRLEGGKQCRTFFEIQSFPAALHSLEEY